MIAFNSHSAGESASNEIPARYWDQALHQPVNQFLATHGKRIRADIVDLAYSVGGGRGQVPTKIVRFVELLHAGSLIIDDVQDDAAVRRGRPALHREFGNPLAINTGNWMYFAAFEELANLSIGPRKQAAIMRRALRIVRQCHEGQALDLATDVSAVPQDEVSLIASAISGLKTGGLVSLAAWLGAAIADASPSIRQFWSTYGMRLGVALQMQNDLAELRHCAANDELSDDLTNARVTWPWAWAAQVCTATEFETFQKTKELIPLSKRLVDCVGTLGSEVVRRELRDAFEGLQRQLGRSNVPKRSCQILERLEQYHV